MKVLVVHSELGVLRGGGENFTRHLFTAFAERGHEVSAVFVADRRGRYPIPIPENIHPIPLPGWWSRKFGQGALSFAGRRIGWAGVSTVHWDRVHEAVSWRSIRWHNRRFQRRIEVEFADRWNRYDAVYVHGDVMLAASIVKHRPVVLRLPGPVGTELADPLRSINAVCANGDALVRLRASFGDLFTELPPGVDDRVFSPGPTPVRARLGWTSEHLVAGYVGRLTHLKGVDLLAAAFHQIAGKFPDARFLIIGNGELERTVRSVLAEHISSGVIHMESDVPHDRLAQWYRAMDVMVMPSRYENFSNSILEAMACGISFLASDVGGNRMLAETGAGTLFEADSADSIVEAMSHFLTSPPEGRAQGSEGVRHVSGRYSWRASSVRLESLLQAHVA